jgi:aminocarboxymuconate-semialdehyde decarboxylase
VAAIQLHTCGASCPPGCTASRDAARAAARRDRRRPTIDVHCHAFVPAVEALVADRPEKLAELAALHAALGASSAEHNERVMLPAAAPRLVNLDTRLADMDAMGVDIQVVSPSPSQYYYWAQPELAEALVRANNEGIAELCARQPERLVGLGTVALQHPQLAARQLEHCVRELGFKGVLISSCIGTRELADAEFAPFWRQAEALGCVVFIHPFGASVGRRLDRHYLSNILGQPLETTIALSHLIFSGTLDRYSGVKILAAHGGGFLPHYMGRFDHGHRVRPEAGGCARAPSAYLRRIWFDSLVYQPEILRALIERVGASQVLVGTDYPFDMGSYDVHRLLEGLGAEERAAILGGNALRLFGLSVPEEAVGALSNAPGGRHGR